MPEAAADVDDFSSGGEDEVGGAGEGFDVEAVAIAEGVDAVNAIEAAKPLLQVVRAVLGDF